MADLARLGDTLRAYGRVVLGYSGGVDSAVLAVVGSRWVGPGRFLAVIGRSASYPEVQWRTALEVARGFGVPLREIDTAELEDPRYVANSTDRCFFCKSELWARLGALAEAEGFDAVIDGTNADDLLEHRPGFRASLERGVRSPFVELGWGKTAVRAAARDLGLPVWDAPSSPCLSSRIRYGLEVTRERLAQVEEGEAFLRGLGVAGDLRVRHHGDRARIEVRPAMFPLLDIQWGQVETHFARLGFARVERDPAGYRRGGLLPALSPMLGS